MTNISNLILSKLDVEIQDKVHSIDIIDKEVVIHVDDSLSLIEHIICSNAEEIISEAGYLDYEVRVDYNYE